MFSIGNVLAKVAKDSGAKAEPGRVAQMPMLDPLG
jgi:hypothetical protein